MSRVVVIGGGVIGCAVAERLSFEGHQVTLFERDQLGGRASGAAAGELSAQSTTSAAEESAQQSLQLFPELIARIEKDSAMNVEYRVQAGLQPAFDQEEAARLRAFGGSWLDAQACHQAEPSLSTDVLGAVLLEHAHLTPRRLGRALARAAAARGAAVLAGTPVLCFERAGNQVKGGIAPTGSHHA